MGSRFRGELKGTGAQVPNLRYHIAASLRTNVKSYRASSVCSREGCAGVLLSALLVLASLALAELVKRSYLRTDSDVDACRKLRRWDDH